MTLYAGLNAGIGQPMGERLWEPTLNLLLETKQPCLFTAYDANDMDSELSRLRRLVADGEELQWWLEPELNPFGSLRPDVDVVNEARVIFSNWGRFGFVSN
mmetsp:Transcript_45640/g.107684  ORF Transcript_45640/g.107684 Transcript_45640/m.107684 type:complete len:101 (-) Transcript_45640:32-334(-)